MVKTLILHREELKSNKSTTSNFERQPRSWRKKGPFNQRYQHWQTLDRREKRKRATERLFTRWNCCTSWAETHRNLQKQRSSWGGELTWGEKKRGCDVKNNRLTFSEEFQSAAETQRHKYVWGFGGGGCFTCILWLLACCLLLQRCSWFLPMCSRQTHTHQRRSCERQRRCYGSAARASRMRLQIHCKINHWISGLSDMGFSIPMLLTTHHGVVLPLMIQHNSWNGVNLAERHHSLRADGPFFTSGLVHRQAHESVHKNLVCICCQWMNSGLQWPHNYDILLHLQDKWTIMLHSQLSWSCLLGDFNLKFSLQKWRPVTHTHTDFHRFRGFGWSFLALTGKHASVLQSVESVLWHEDALYLTRFFFLFPVEKTWFVFFFKYK